MSYLVSAKPLSPFRVELTRVGASSSGWGDMTPPLAWAEGLLTQGHPVPSPLSLLLLHLLPQEGPERLPEGKESRRNRKTWSKRDGQKGEKREWKRKEEVGQAMRKGETTGRRRDGMGEELYTSKLNL
jgi:hypothetical protein